MGKQLEKALKDAIKEKKRTIGTKQVLSTIKNSKFIIISKSIPKPVEEKIIKSAKDAKVPTLNFEGSSVALGRLCGLQFRISTISLTSISDANVKSILIETKTK